MNESLVQFALPAESVVVVQSALMRVATEALTRGDVPLAMRVRREVRRISEQSLGQWERFEVAGFGDYERAITERAAQR